MDIRKVKKLIELLDESGIAEIEITEGEESVRISRHASKSAPAPAPAVAAPAVAPPAPAPAPAAAPRAAPSPPPAAAPDAEDDGHAVTAPMVGTYYSAPSPGSPAFVQVGDKINKAIERVATGQQSGEEAMAQAQAEAVADLEKSGVAIDKG